MLCNVCVELDGVPYTGHNRVTALGITRIRDSLISGTNFNSPLKFWLAGTGLESGAAVPPPTRSEISGGETNRHSILWRHQGENRASSLMPTTISATLASATDATPALFEVEWSALRNSNGLALPSTLPAAARLTLTWELSPSVGALDNWPTSLSGIGSADDFSQSISGGDSQYRQALRNFSRRLLSNATTSAGEVRIYNDTEDDSNIGDPAFLSLRKVHTVPITFAADGDAGMATPAFTIPASSTWSPGPGSGRSLTAGTFSYALMVGRDAAALPVAVRGANVGEGGTYQTAISALSWGADVS